MRDELIAGLKSIPDENGHEIGTQVYRPEELYKEVRGVAPDLIVYFGDLYWRSVGTVGGGKMHTFENDTGPDGANHAENGIFFWRPADGGSPDGRRIDGREDNGCGANGFAVVWAADSARHGGQAAR